MATNFISYLTAGAAAMLLSACNGILSNIYDEPSTDAVSEYGFVSEATTTSPGSIYIDATDYTVWTYIDFRSMTTTALDVNAPVPASWDIAIHRYDTKTNGAEVMETGATSFYSLANVVTPTENDYVSDIWTTTTKVTDMSSRPITRSCQNGSTSTKAQCLRSTLRQTKYMSSGFPTALSLECVWQTTWTGSESKAI